MIIKTMLDELFAQVKEVSYFEDMEMHKVVNNEHVSSYYRYSENRNNDLLDKLNNKISWNKDFLKSINTKQPVLSENDSYAIDNEMQKVLSYTIPIVFRDETVFLINMISFDKDICCTEQQRRDIDEIVFSFEKFFCLGEMIKIDVIRDRLSLVS